MMSFALEIKETSVVWMQRKPHAIPVLETGVGFSSESQGCRVGSTCLTVLIC